MGSINMYDIVGKHSILFITLDTLRYDVAVKCFREGTIPNFARWMPQGWEERHTPGTFTLAAHQAFFAGFLPTPAMPGKHERLFATYFEGSQTTTEKTYVFDSPDIVSGLQRLDYKTVCIGGVGFFNKKTPLGNVLPSMFSESYWCPEFGVTDRNSTANQFHFASNWIRNLSVEQKFFVFINISAIHQPNYFYSEDETRDSIRTHEAALQYIDTQFPILTDTLQERGDTFCIVCSDHGTTYGEDGYTGHRLSHPHVLTVPYAQGILNKK